MVRLSPPRYEEPLISLWFSTAAFIRFVQQFVRGNNLEVNMKMVKSLILGSAAGLIAVGGAQAADLPVKAAAVEYVRICSLYGAGFYYVPGTDTCIKIGGYLRADTIGNSGNDYGFSNGAPDGAMNRLRNNFTSRARQDLTIDTRTATEYGVVRTFAELVFTWTGGEYVGAGYTHTTRPGGRRFTTARPAPLAAPSSVCTTRSSSSLGSRSVARIRSSTRRGRAIRLAALIPFRAAATMLPV